jgi:hypothetical protein
VPRREKITPHHCFYLAWHHLAIAFLFCSIGGIAIGLFLAPVFRPVPVSATTNDNVRGWAWADPIGWISLNDQNPGSGGGTYGVNLDFSTGELTGFGWSENAGWICFGSSCSAPECNGTVPTSNPPFDIPYAAVVPVPFSDGPVIRNAHGWAKVCGQGDSGWISLNCSDPLPSACGSYPYRVPFDMSTQQFTDPTAPGSPDNGTSFAWNGNGDGSGLGFVDFHLAYVQTSEETTPELCANGFDDDLNGVTDCDDAQCNLICFPPPPPDLTEDQCPLGTADLCCSDNADNEGDGKIDCEDSDCQGSASMCTVSWLKTKFGNVYAQKGIESIAPPGAQFNASYCLSYSEGSISGFASKAGCVEAGQQLALPNESNGYVGTFGSIDVQGIANGRYGTIVQIADGSAIPEQLDGKVYLYTGGGTLQLPIKTFQNGSGANGRGNGLLFVKGADLEITGDLFYSSPSVEMYLKNLASFGVIVTSENGNGGNITIAPEVSSIVGSYFAEKSFSTGASVLPLNAYGMFASHQFSFERTGGTSSTAAETISFDGRAMANPPPGMQNVGKSLPSAKTGF